MQLDERALWSVSYGLYVVTGRAGGRANGQIANAVCQVTAVPPRVAVAVNHDNFTHDLIRDGGHFAFSVLADTAPMELIGLFGFRSGRDVDKLAGVAVREGAHCPLVVEHALSVVEARVIASVDAGTHTVFVGEVVGAEVVAQGTALTYLEYHARKGRAPATAPTYRGAEEEKAAAPRPAGEAASYTCGVCGHTYVPADGDPEHGVPAGTRFEDLPEGWVCPVCGAGRDAFERD